MEMRPKGRGVLICGRSHYFPTEEELCDALGVAADHVLFAELRELSNKEASNFLGEYGVSVPLSRWLPKRPLLLLTVAQRFSPKFDPI
jgi:hypothetical protein